MAIQKARKAYSLFKKNNRPNYYVRFRNEVTGDWNSSGKSTGTSDILKAEKIAMEWLVNCGAEKPTVKTQSVIDIIRKEKLTLKDVQTICGEFQRQGLLKSFVVAKSKKAVKAIDYFKRYYTADSAERLADDRNITKGYAESRSRCVRKYWADFLGDKYLADFTADDLRSYKLKLQENTGISELTKRNIFNTGLVAFRQARIDGLIDDDISGCVKSFRGKSKKKGILTPEQAEAVFTADWENNKIKLGNYLAYRTGFRVGEVIGLQKEDLRFIDGRYYIELRHSYSRTDGLKGTKTNADSLVPINDEELMKSLLYLAERNPYKNGYVFWGKKADRPICSKQMLQGLKDVLKDLGFADSAEKITFHSWRHFHRTYMQIKGGASCTTLSKVACHSVEMISSLYSNHYTALDEAEYRKADSIVYTRSMAEYFGLDRNVLANSGDKMKQIDVA